ncbi:MAG: hypothetical protein FD123_2092 [Bacteroidetes bacterium]|nr:MAG: hypothetical protein FD123_2092 [Bacteroidota bacterium]
MADQKMNKYAVRKEIAALIDSIKEHSDNIGTRKHIPQIELELILHKIEKLYQKSIVFNFLNSMDGGEGILQETPVVPEVKPLPAKEKIIPPPPPEKKEEPLPAGEIKTPEVKTDIPPVQPPETKQPDPPKAEPVPPAQKKHPDIKTRIGFNEKIMFIRSLFGGDAAAYEEAIKQINACNTADEAQAFVSVLKNEFNWKAGDEASESFMHLVKMRFA